jgi:O-succinylbenzoate synthase
VDIVDHLAAGRLPAIATIDLHRVRIPLRRPFRASHGIEREREVVLAGVTLPSGVIGWGECPTLARPGYTPEHTDLAWRVLSEQMAPDWLAGRAGSPGEHPMARSALEAAVLDACLRELDRSLVDALGATRAPVPACAVLGLAESVGALVDEAGARVQDGHRHLKLKIEPGRDVEAVLAVRSAFPDVTLAVDANGSYGSADAVPGALGDADLRYLEQPVPPRDLVGSAAVMEHLSTPVALDESIMSVADLQEAADRGALGAVNVKPARLGGIVEGLAVMRAATDRGIDVFVGGMLETGVGRAAALALASHPSCTLPTDLGPSSRYFADDLVAPIELDDSGEIRAPEGVGVGVVPDPDRLDHFSVDRWSSTS